MAESYEVMLAEEKAIAHVQAMALRLMAEKNIKRTALADAMDVSAAHISQLLGDEPQNLSVRKAARLFYHLGEELTFSCGGIEKMDARAEANHQRKAEVIARYKSVPAWQCFGPSNDGDCDPAVGVVAAA